MTFTPATPETYVVEVNKDSSLGYTLTPVVGWVVESGRPLPLTLHGKFVLPAGSAILFKGGMTQSPEDILAFDSIEAWLESAPTKPRQHKTEAVAKAAPAAPASDEAAYDIEWTDATFKNNSFWHYDDGTYEFVFQIEGENSLPKATKKVVKIKRDEFMAMKKETDVLTVDEIMSADPLPAPEADEEEDEDDLI